MEIIYINNEEDKQKQLKKLTLRKHGKTEERR
jgi:hypothetical protein